MAPETLIFMPNGDVTLTLIRYVLEELDDQSSASPDLSKPSTRDKTASALADAPVDEDMGLGGALGPEPEEPQEPEESLLYFAPDPPEDVNGPLYPPPPRARRGSNASSRRDRSVSPPASFWASLKRQAAMAVEPSKEEQAATQPIPAKTPEKIVKSSHEVHCVVSSRHMVLASQYFQRILGGNSKEAITLRTKGHVTIRLSDDLETIIILLNIIHGASRKVPRQVSLEVLSKLAVLVSKFEVLETVGYFSDTWIDEFQRSGLPTLYNDHVISLIFVFWAFDRPAEFKDMTRLAQRGCSDKVNEDVRDVPISPRIIDAIKRDREHAISTAITVVHTIMDRYMAGQTICDGSLDDELRYACDSMVLGSLMNSSRKIGIWPMSDALFNGKNYKDLASAIRTIRILDVCNKTSNRKWNSHGPSSNCHGLEDTIKVSMESIEASLDGLELSDYTRKSDDYTSGFQVFPATPLINELKEEVKDNTGEQAQVYPTEEAAEEVEEMAEEDETEHFQVYATEDVVEGWEEEMRALEREQESRASGRTNLKQNKDTLQEQTHNPNTAKRYLEDSLKAEAKISPRPSSWVLEAPAQEEVKDSPGQFPTWFRQHETRVSPRGSVPELQEPDDEEVKPTPKHSSSQGSRIFPIFTAKPVEESANEDVKPLLSEEVHLPEYRKLNRTSSFRKIPIEEIKLPVKELQLESRVPSIEEMIEEVSHPVNVGLKSSTFEVRESTNAAPAKILAEETRAPKNFKMTKSKKTFSARY